MDDFTLILTTAVGVFVTTMAAVMMMAYRKDERKFRDSLSAALGSGVEWDEKKQAFRQGGMNFRYEKHPGSKNSPPSFSLLLECPITGGEFEIGTEGATERFFKNIGITQEVQTGDDAFDHRCFIASNTPVFAGECFASTERRETVKRFFDMRVCRITYRGNCLRVKWEGHASHMEGVSNLKETLGLMAGLARDLPQNREVVSLACSVGGGPAIRVLMLGIAAISVAFGIVSLIWSFACYPPLDAGAMFLFSLKFSVPALILFLFLAVKALSGRSRSHWDILLAGTLAIAGFLFSGYGAVGLYNGKADISMPASHVAVIQNKRAHRNKNSTSYYFRVPSWRAGRTVEELSTDQRTYARVVPGKYEAVIRTRAGKLGFEWLVSYGVRAEEKTL